MLKRTYKKPEKGLNYSKFVSDYAKQTGGNYKELLKDPKVKEMWKSRGKTVKFASQQAQAQTQAPTTQAPTTQALTPELRSVIAQAPIPNKVSNLKLTANNVIDNILLGKNVNDTGLERSYLQRVYNFLNSITPTKYYKESSADDFNLEPIAYLMRNIKNAYIDSPFSWEFAVYARNPVKMFPGKRDLRLIFNDLNSAFDTDSYRRFTNIKSEGDRAIDFTVEEVKENGYLIDLYNEVNTLYKQTNDVNLVWYNDTFYKRKISVINLIIYLYYCSMSKCEKMIYVTDKDFGTNLTTFWKNLDIASIQDIDFNNALEIDNSPLENMDIVNVINYLSGRSYQTNEAPVAKQQEQVAYQGNIEGYPEGYTEYNEPVYQQQQQPTFLYEPIAADQTTQDFAKQPVEQQYETVTSAYMEAKDYEDKSSDIIDELTKEKSVLEETLTAQKEEQNNIEEKHKQEIKNIESKLKEKEDELKEKDNELKEKDEEISKLNKDAQTVSAELEKKVKEKAEFGKLFAETEAKTNDDADTIKRIRAKKREYKKDYLDADKKSKDLTRKLKEKDKEIKNLESEKKDIISTKEFIEKETNKFTKLIETAEKSFAKKQKALEAKISELESNKSSLEKELKEEKGKNKVYIDNIEKLEEIISSMEAKNKELTKTLPSKRTKQPAPKRLSESSTTSSVVSSSTSSIRRKEPPVRRLKELPVASVSDEVYYYDTLYDEVNKDREDSRFYIHAHNYDNDAKLNSIKKLFAGNEIYYFEWTSNKNDKRLLYKLGEKDASDILGSTSAAAIYFTIVGNDLLNRLSRLGIKAVEKDIKEGILEGAEESVFLGGSYSRLTGGSVFDDVKVFLQYFNISSMEKLPSIAKGKNTYLFRF